MASSKKVFEFKDDLNGSGKVLFSWSQDCSYIAVCGQSKVVYVLDKRGRKLKETVLKSKNKVIGLEWDKDQEFLAILQENSTCFLLWNVFQNSFEQQDLEEKSKGSFIKWSKTHPVLVIGTEKGILYFYNKKTQKKIPTMGKHSKKITTGDWNDEGLLITGSEEKVLTVSSHNSDSKGESITVQHEPSNLQWARQKTDDRDSSQRTITAILSNKSILMYDLNTKKQPLELVYEPKYGKIVDYQLFGDGYIVTGFTEGYVAHVSSHLYELRDEIQSKRIFQSSLDALCTNDIIYKLAVAGENQIHIYNLGTWEEVKSQRIELPKAAGNVTKMQWANNGQLLVVATANGHLYGYLTSIPFLTSTYGSIVSVLSSFTEVSIVDTSRINQIQNVSSINLETEPGFLSLGLYHLAAGINNNVWYYLWLDQKRNGIIKGGEMIQKRDYLGSVKDIRLNEFWAAVLTDGKCILHTIQPNNNVKDQKFPQIETDKAISGIGLTNDFLIMLDSSGKIRYYHLEDQQFVVEYKPADCQLVKIYPNFSGTRVVCFDNKGSAYLFEPAQEQFYPLEHFPQRAEKVLWDQKDPNLFAVLQNDTLITFIINKNNINGTLIQPVKELLAIEDIKNPGPPVQTILDRGVKPLTLSNGLLKCFTPSGSINGQNLTSHSYLGSYKGRDDTDQGHYRFFLQNLQLHKYNNCLIAAQFLHNAVLYKELGRKALEFVDLDVALKSYQLAGSLSMVMTIQSFQHINEKNIIYGNIAMILGQYDLAQELFLKSSQPILALEMRSDIQDYLTALNLAKSIAPQEEPFICRRLAFQIENQGNNQEARKLYERAVLNKDDRPSDRSKIDNHNQLCFAGISRTSIKLGDIQRGVTIAKELIDNNIVIEIAVVCENMKQYLEAAELYQKSGMLEKAASLYIESKDFKKAAPLISMIKSPNLLKQYAKAKESEGAYNEAEQTYEQAESWEDVVRLNLDKLDNLRKAIAVLRTKCDTSTVCLMVANVCEKQGNYGELVEFLLKAGKKEEAFQKAQQYNVMDAYSDNMKDFTLEERLRIAQYYENQGIWVKAAKHFEQAKNPTKSLKLYLKAGDQYIDDMIDLVCRNKQQESLQQTLLDYLLEGEKPKDPIYLLKLYDKLGNIQSLVKIAITIASDEHDQGNYKIAHERLFETYQKVKEHNVAIPFDLEQKLMIIHSYILARKYLAYKEEDKEIELAAWLLNRVCKNISQFPTHAVNILTSAVIAAMKSKNRPLAYKWSVELVRPEYRSHINEKYKTRIENIARKPLKEEPVENKTECPFCKEYVGEFQLVCESCQNVIPFCIASGTHVIADQLCFCPSCRFPANINYFIKYAESEEGRCPMCSVQINLNEVKVENPEQAASILKQLRATRQSSEQKKK
ncbi:WD40 repeat protein (macronuclear) [Tetrahymena thermophila SB210]|uniref:WD40 repeat protein n=1 Tax=Tetrahymena thermophila (strain SB210) TaxID=312017 RepID=Q22BP2_TETTS|nr:WD40 repeat protein [Tetrahymena thermophila SB210]EAR82687.2 WD40 repeat protein [Tetrahymena thermophila SB210]8HME_E Chain E, WD40 repeat protein [Tetrahymena thermophila]8HMF_E Chain E, WD40 repeat protein [Tetrahymena thermophila]|eukprot:XP_001030350.2 WD40 repeat protein [Tetrahymena thermophila SB210]